MEYKVQKKTIHPSLRAHFSNEELDELKSAFALFEEENGLLNVEKLSELFINLNFDTKEKNIMNMIISLKENKFISFNDFLLGCEKFLGKNLPDEELKKLYASFSDDGSDSGKITTESFKKILSNLGEEMSDDEVKFLFDLNSNNKGFFDYNDFIKLFKKNK